MIELGAKFHTYAQFQTALETYEKISRNKFWVRDCRTLVTHARKFPNSPAASAPENLKYYFAAISCVQGGRSYESKNKKRQVKTLRRDCQAGLYLKLSKCCEYLEIVKLNVEHNHELTDGLKNKAHEFIFGDTIGDLKFLATLVEDRHNCDGFDEYYECIESLEGIYNCEVNMLFDQDDNVLGIFFQDPAMKLFFNAYPEAIFIETEYCLYNGGPLVCMFLIEDPAGNGVVVAVAILLRQDPEIIDWMVNQFPECNQNCKDIEVVLCKKHYDIMRSFGKVFPRISPHIPVHQFMEQIESDLTSSKLNLGKEEIKVAKAYMQELVFSVSQQNYRDIFKQMESNVNPKVMKYYRTNWKDIQEQWVMYRTINYRYFINQTGKNVGNIWLKLRSVIKSFTNLKHFIKKFFTTLYIIRSTPNSISNLTFDNNNESKDERAYKKLLTTYAFEIVQVQMIMSKDCDNIQTICPNNIIMSTSEGLLEVTETSCACMFRSSMMLPCRHIFKFRTVAKLPLYDENICSDYWFKSRYEAITNHDIAKSSISRNEKIKTMNDISNKLSGMCSKVPVDLFEKRLRYMRYLLQRWSDADGDDDDMEDVDAEFTVVNVGTDECVLIKREDRVNEFILSSNGNGFEEVKIVSGGN